MKFLLYLLISPIHLTRTVCRPRVSRPSAWNRRTDVSVTDPTIRGERKIVLTEGDTPSLPLLEVGGTEGRYVPESLYSTLPRKVIFVV